MILVDTSVLIDFFKGTRNDQVTALKECITRQMPFGISSVIYQEVLQGAKNKKEFELLQTYLGCQHFFNPLDPVRSYEDAARIFFTCRRKGITIRSTIDCLIAQTAIEQGLYLLHNDMDFDRIASLTELKIYPV